MPAFGAGLGGTLSFVGAFRFTQQVGPVVVWSTGIIASAGIVRNGAGDYSCTFISADYSLDDTEMIWWMNRYSAVAASGLWAPGISSTSDTVKRITTLVEGAAGAVSALTDIGDMCVEFWKRPIR